MDLGTARRLMNEHLMESFGKIVELRAIQVVRQAVGRMWVGELYRATHYGEVMVGSIAVTEQGELRCSFGVDTIIDVLSQLQSTQDPNQARAAPRRDTPIPRMDLSDFADDRGDETIVEGYHEADEFDDFFIGFNVPKLQRQIARLLSSGRRSDLREARRKLPLLLPDPERRGEVLHRMAELEILIGDVDDGLNYLEAAAREFADRADLSTLEHVAQRVRQVLGDGLEHEHTVYELLARTRSRMVPIRKIEETEAFSRLHRDAILRIQESANLRVEPADTELIREEERPVRAFVVKSGVLSVWVESASGGERFVRCCFPGELVGESSVLGDKNASCTATVRTQTEVTLWEFSGSQLRTLAEAIPDLKTAIENTEVLHRLDSYFSTGSQAMVAVRVRDRLLSCFSGIAKVNPGDEIFAAGAAPHTVYLLVEGRAEQRMGSQRLHDVAGGDFIGLHNAIHKIPFEASWVALEPCQLVAFDGEQLRTLAESAPVDVLGVLESLDQ